MDRRAELYDLLGRVLEYPGPRYRADVASCRRELGRSTPEAAEGLDSFETKTQGLTPEQMEELFTRTFDLNPTCCLEVGWHLFGENYDRGRFLVWMRGELRRFGLRESSELPDHLRHVLAVLGRMSGPDADGLAATVLPAVERMLSALKGKENPYEDLLNAIRFELRSSHSVERGDLVALPIHDGALHTLPGESR